MSTAVLEAFDRLEWHDDRVVIGDLVLQLEGSEPDVTPGDRLRFFKGKHQVDQYHDLLSKHPGFRPERVFELGIWDGGSTAFWCELFSPETHVAVDLMGAGDNHRFREYASSKAGETRIETFWSVDQSDKARLREIVSTSFDGPLDLVIDDASHLYAPTKASFEALFPWLAPGGLFVVEDWPWGHDSSYRDPSHPWAEERPLTDLLVELVRAVGSAPELLSRVYVYFAFFVVERGPAAIDDHSGLSLDELVARTR